jgi:hypothetical protein
MRYLLQNYCWHTRGGLTADTEDRLNTLFSGGNKSAEPNPEIHYFNFLGFGPRNESLFGSYKKYPYDIPKEWNKTPLEQLYVLLWI